MLVFLCDITTLGTKTKVIWNYKGKTGGFVFVQGLKHEFANFTRTKITFYPKKKVLIKYFDLFFSHKSYFYFYYKLNYISDNLSRILLSYNLLTFCLFFQERNDFNHMDSNCMQSCNKNILNYLFFYINEGLNRNRLKYLIKVGHFKFKTNLFFY
jgi:hypothetical protein